MKARHNYSCATTTTKGLTTAVLRAEEADAGGNNGKQRRQQQWQWLQKRRVIWVLVPTVVVVQKILGVLLAITTVTLVVCMGVLQCRILLRSTQAKYRDAPRKGAESIQGHALPIVVVGLPKVGTKTIHKFFERAGYDSTHFHCDHRSPQHPQKKLPCADCFQRVLHHHHHDNATAARGSLWNECGDFQVYSQIDMIRDASNDANNNPTTTTIRDCYFPQITDLHLLHEQAPNATWILNTRNVTHWIRSMRHWNHYDQRLVQCRANNLGPRSTRISDMEDWYFQHLDRIRSFCHHHPSHNLIEVDIEDPNAGNYMADIFGLDPQNWLHTHDNAAANLSSFS